MSSVLPKTYTKYRAEMDETTLTRTAPRTFTYRETTFVTEKGSARALSARVTVQMVAAPGIRIGEPGPGLDKQEPRGSQLWRLSSFETSMVRRVSPR